MKIRNLILGSVVCAVATCSQAQNTLSEVNDGTPPEKAADLVWAGIFTTCGQSSYYTELRAPVGHSFSEMTIIEYKRLRRFPLEPLQLSPAERANGLQYKGIARVGATMWRAYTKRDPKGSDWSDNPVFRIRMTKYKGKWTFEADAQPGCGHECSFGNSGTFYSDLEEIRVTGRLSNPKLSCSDIASADPFRPKANGPPLFAFSGRESFDELKRKAEYYGELRDFLESIGRDPVEASQCDRNEYDFIAIAYDPLLAKAEPGTRVTASNGKCYMMRADAIRALKVRVNQVQKIVDRINAK
jgi:hypothetical protein